MNNILKFASILIVAFASSHAFSNDIPDDFPAVSPCGDSTAAGVLQGGLCFVPEGSGASKRTDKRLYMGLVWSFGANASKTPDILVGFQSLQVNSDNKVKGADLSVRLQPAKNYSVEGVRLSYLNGNRNAIANLGAGYSFATGSPLITAAVQAAHVRAGTDYLLASKSFAPYFEVNTRKRAEPTGSNQSCSNGELRTIASNLSSDQAMTLYFNPSAFPGIFTGDKDLVTSPYTFQPAGSKTCFLPEEAPQ